MGKPQSYYLCTMIRGTLVMIPLLWMTLVSAQTDTIRLMQYNLLNYRNTTGQCTNSTNNAEKKDGHLQTIVAHVKPDVLMVNEMGANWLNPNKLLNNALNKNGVSHFDQAEYANNSFSSLANMLFFNKDKLVLFSQDAIAKDTFGADLVRVIDVYTLYIKNDGLAFGDTTFLTFFLVHLKAGSGSSDKEQRAKMTIAAMEYLKKRHTTHNYFFAGDFNIQTHSEACYQELTKNSAPTIRFYDPKDAPGSWNNNSLYANLHTQSTHSGDSRGGCFSTGGMDDRFDFILCGKEVMDDTYGVRYLSGTYKAVGQDSRRFNGDVTTPTNNSVPSNVATALYEMSDHLPVRMDIEVTSRNTSQNDLASPKQLVVGYGQNGIINIYHPRHTQLKRIGLYNNSGQLMKEINVRNNTVNTKLDLSTYAFGLYVVKALDENGVVYTQKVTFQ